jgi:hypothetical protein
MGVACSYLAKKVVGVLVVLVVRHKFQSLPLPVFCLDKPSEYFLIFGTFKPDRKL